MPELNNLKENLKSRIEKYSDEKRKEWFENYIKHNTKYRGVEITKVRAELKEWYLHEKIGELPLDVQLTKDNRYTSQILESSEILIRRDERFAKTAVGWIVIVTHNLKVGACASLTTAFLQKDHPSHVISTLGS